MEFSKKIIYHSLSKCTVYYLRRSRIIPRTFRCVSRWPGCPERTGTVGSIRGSWTPKRWSKVFRNRSLRECRACLPSSFITGKFISINMKAGLVNFFKLIYASIVVLSIVLERLGVFNRKLFTNLRWVSFEMTVISHILTTPSTSSSVQFSHLSFFSFLPPVPSCSCDATGVRVWVVWVSAHLYLCAQE